MKQLLLTRPAVIAVAYSYAAFPDLNPDGQGQQSGADNNCGDKSIHVVPFFAIERPSLLSIAGSRHVCIEVDTL